VNDDTASREMLQGRLVDLAAQLDAIADYIDHPDAVGASTSRWMNFLAGGSSQSPDRQRVLRRWRSLFAEELDQVRRTRNSVVHGVDVSDQNLENAINIAQRLLDLAKQAFTGSESGAG
jgi:hypothetical protein